MAYIRWSDQINDDCATCGGKGRIAEGGEEYLCSGCMSCWYAYHSTRSGSTKEEQVLSISHSCASGCGSWDLTFAQLGRDTLETIIPELPACPNRELIEGVVRCFMATVDETHIDDQAEQRSCGRQRGCSDAPVWEERQ